MPYTVPTLDELHGFVVALFKLLLPTRNAARFSWAWKFLRTLAAGVTDNHAHVSAVERDLWPDTAEGDALEHWGRLMGVAKKAATPARKANALRVVGSPASPVPLNTELEHSETGLRFKVNEASVVPVGGSVDVDIVAIDTGAATRLNAGEVLTFVSAPPGLEETAELVLDVDEDGTDREADGAQRLRVLSRFSNPPLGGAQEDYRQWALQVTGIADAFVYPNRQGWGSVDVAALHEGTGTARILTADEKAALQAYLDARRPIGVKAMRVLDVFAEPVDVAAVVIATGEAQYNFDWPDATPLEVNSWSGVSRTLQFQSARPLGMVPGHRVVIATAGGTGEQHVIESLSGADAVVLEVAPSVLPLEGDLVYSGGPLVGSVRDALMAHVNALGTANPDSRRYGSWEGNLRPAAIIRVASRVPGVLDVTGTTPAVTVEASDPAYPADGTIGLLVPGRVLVRRAWPVLV